MDPQRATNEFYATESVCLDLITPAQLGVIPKKLSNLDRLEKVFFDPNKIQTNKRISSDIANETTV